MTIKRGLKRFGSLPFEYLYNDQLYVVLPGLSNDTKIMRTKHVSPWFLYHHEPVVLNVKCKPYNIWTGLSYWGKNCFYLFHEETQPPTTIFPCPAKDFNVTIISFIRCYVSENPLSLFLPSLFSPQNFKKHCYTVSINNKPLHCYLSLFPSSHLRTKTRATPYLKFPFFT